MKFSKHTPDRYWRITVESELMEDMDEDEPIPSDALNNLIIELELLAAELRRLTESESDNKVN